MCGYVQAYIHQLPFDVPVGVYALPLSSLEGIVRDFYLSIRRTSASSIAYKGRGHFERDLLANFDIPAIDLEQYRCQRPKS